VKARLILAQRTNLASPCPRSLAQQQAFSRWDASRAGAPSSERALPTAEPPSRCLVRQGGSTARSLPAVGETALEALSDSLFETEGRTTQRHRPHCKVDGFVTLAEDTPVDAGKIYLTPILDREQLRLLRGARPSEQDFDAVVDATTDAYDAEDGRLIFRFQKRALALGAIDLAREVFGDIDVRMPPSFRRKTAAGKLDVERIRVSRPDVVAVVPVAPGAFEGHFVLESGKRLRYPMSNPVLSFMAGYNYDRYRGVGVPTGFTAKYPDKWRKSIPFFESVSNALAETMPDVAKHMREWCASHGVAPDFTIGDAFLSSVAINVNYESCYHLDHGDLPTGYSTLTAMAVGGTYAGGLLVLPRYRIAIDVQEGDLLCNQSHIDLHGNTAVRPGNEGAKRLSFVTYLKRLLKHAKRPAQKGVAMVRGVDRLQGSATPPRDPS
jgi:hypothetical protein